MTYYRNDHVSQYDPGCSAITRSSGCTWTSGRNGADAATGGMVDITPDQVKAKVKVSEETDPDSPGWSLQDLDKAMSRIGVPFDPRNGQGWDKLKDARRVGQYIVLQGLSAEFGNHTCSGAFNGTHAIGIHPDTNGQGLWRIDDPICPTSRYESESILRRYAERFSRSVAFGVFTTPVPQEDEPMKQLPITDQTPKNVTLQQPCTFYDLDGKGDAGGHNVPGTFYSPYQASNGTNHFRSIYAGPDPVKLVLVKPATITPVPASDTEHRVRLVVDGIEVYDEYV